MLPRLAIAGAALAVSVACPRPAAAEPERVSAAVGEVAAETLRLYRWLHAHPELSGEEDETAARLAAELRGLGLEVQTDIGGHGVVGILANGPGPVVLYRADMDALPVTERTGLAYASRNPGVMHACGHDIHMATAVGALRIMKQLAAAWSGTIVFVGQPAEEVGAGARMMLADRRFRDLLTKHGTPSLALAIHDDADLPAGRVSLLPGFANANVDSVDITVHGRGGHGARPHQTVDPIVIGAELVLALQTIVSRRIAADEPAVITVGRFAAGTKHNIIPPSAELLLTVRSYAEATRTRLLAEIERTAVHVARAHGAPRPPTIAVRAEHTPAAYNDPAWTARLERRFRDALGEAAVGRHQPSMGGEDFGLFASRLGIPGVMWRVGAVNPRTFARADGKGLAPLHSDRYAPDAGPTLTTAMTTVVLALLDALGPDARGAR